MTDKVYEVTPQDIEIFKEWLTKIPYLPQDEDEECIKSFIIGAKGSIETAKVRFNNYYKSAQMMPELYQDYDPLSERSEKFNKLVALCRIPTDDNGNLIVTKLLSTDPTDYDIAEYFVRHFYNIQVMIWDKATGNGKIELLIDATGVNVGHFKTLSVVVAEKLMSCVMKANPLRIKGIHVYNVPPFVEWVVNMFLQFMSEKLRNRVQLHSSLESVQNAISKKYLPSDFGGDQPSMEVLYEGHKKRLEHYRDRLIAQKEKRAAELALRPKDETDDAAGTFRKLAID